MNSFDQQTVKDLEFSTIREWLVAYAIGETTTQRLMKLIPSNRFTDVKLELDRVNEFLSIRTEGEIFPALDFQELLIEIKLLPIKNAVLSQDGFARLTTASHICNSIIFFFDKREKEYPLLSDLLKDAYYSTEIIDSIEKVFDRRGLVKDDASPFLFEIRQQLKVVKNQLNKN